MTDARSRIGRSLGATTSVKGQEQSVYAATMDSDDQASDTRRRAGVRAWRRTVGSLPMVLVGALTLAGCSSPTMLHPSDFGQTYDVTHDVKAAIPYSDWCNRIWSYDAQGVAASMFGIRGDGFTFVGAMLLEAEPGFTASDLLQDLTAGASACEDRAAETDFLWIEPLTGLPEAVVGWRNGDNARCRDEEARLWGELATQAVDDTHVLMVGFQTCSEEPPIEMDELIRLGLEGVERVGLDD